MGDEAVCGPSYRRREVEQIYYPIDNIKQKFSWVEKDRKLFYYRFDRNYVLKGKLLRRAIMDTL